MSLLRRNCQNFLLNPERKPFFVNAFMDKEGLLALYHELQDELFPPTNGNYRDVIGDIESRRSFDDKPD